MWLGISLTPSVHFVLATDGTKKEILFRLTPLGSELFHAHRTFDRAMERGFVEFLERYNQEESAFMLRVRQDVIATSFLKLASAADEAK